MLGAADPETLFALAGACAAKEAGRALALLHNAFQSGMEPQSLASSMAGHIRSLLTAQLAREDLPDILRTTAEAADRYRVQASSFSMENLLRLLDLFSEAGQTKPWNADPRLTLETAVLRSCVPDDKLRLEEMAARVDALERTLSQLAASGVSHAAKPSPQTQGASAPPRQADDVLIQNTQNIRNAPAHKTKPSDAAAHDAAPPAADDRKLWAKTGDILMRKKPSLMAQMRRGAFAGRNGDDVHMAFALDQGIYAAYFRDNAENVKLVEEALVQAVGGRVRLVIDAAGSEPKATEPSPEKDIIKQAIDLFTREKVEVVADDTPF
jgi:DNA polymerase III gamma/tau subunit